MSGYLGFLNGIIYSEDDMDIDLKAVESGSNATIICNDGHRCRIHGFF